MKILFGAVLSLLALNANAALVTYLIEGDIGLSRGSDLALIDGAHFSWSLTTDTSNSPNRIDDFSDQFQYIAAVYDPWNSESRISITSRPDEAPDLVSAVGAPDNGSLWGFLTINAFTGSPFQDQFRVMGGVLEELPSLQINTFVAGFTEGQNYFTGTDYAPLPSVIDNNDVSVISGATWFYLPLSPTSTTYDSINVTISTAVQIPSALLERLGGLAYYDTEADLTWLADANYAKTSGYSVVNDGQMNRADANAWVAGLDVAGVTGWRLPDTLQPDISCDGLRNELSGPGSGEYYGYNCTGSDMGNLFYNVLGNTGPDGASSPTTYEPYCYAPEYCLTNTGPFSNMMPRGYWSSTPMAYNPNYQYEDYSWGFHFAAGFQNGDHYLTLQYAWAVHDGDVLIDTDNDGVIDSTDAFPANNAASVDHDNDGFPDAWNVDCDFSCQDTSGLILDTYLDDTDNDGVINGNDAFPLDPSEALDSDGDGVGNNADAFPFDSSETLDSDNDGVGDNADAFPLDPTESIDSDTDGIGDDADNCPAVANANQTNTDTDDQGDACDSDDDDDDLSDIDEAVAGTNPLLADTDNDGVRDDVDVFPLDPSESIDSDNDGAGNAVDTDDDNDGVLDQFDAFPFDSSENTDTDLDGIGNNLDQDDDNDGVIDSDDAFPLDSGESVDTDKDGIGNIADPDDDNDGVLDQDDAFPLDSTRSVAESSSGGGSVSLLGLGLFSLLGLARRKV